MWKPAIFSAVVFSLVLIEASPKPTETEPTADDYREKCAKLCKNVSAEMHFDEETLTCKCTLVANVDDAEMAIVEQNAKLLNLELGEEDFTENFRKRRFISANNNNKIIEKFDHAETVGQAPLLPPSGPFLPNRPHITHNAALQNLADIRKRLRDMSHHSSRNAAAHAEAIRHRLRELSNRVIIPSTPEQRLHRARINQERRARERQRGQRLNNFKIHPGARFFPRKPIGVLGAAADDNNATTVSPRKVNRKQSKKQSANDDDHEVYSKNNNHAVITQPEEYMED